MENTIGVYNPFSLLNTFKYNKFGNYWFETGTPSYLVMLLKQSHYDLERMANEVTSSDILNSIYEDLNPIPLIYQSGYLTIKGYDEEFGVYRLGFPNREVEEGFIKYLMPFYTSVDKVESTFEIQKFVNEIRKGQPDAFYDACKVSWLIHHTNWLANWNYITRMFFLLFSNWSVFMRRSNTTPVWGVLI